MSSLTHIPLGQRIPDRLHAVSCSLPTMRAVVGYEEKHAEIVSQLTSGYPRFVVHPLLRAAGEQLLIAAGLPGHDIWLACSPDVARALAAHLGAPARVLDDAALPAVVFPADAALSAQAKKYLQHTGTFLSSREAEDHLVAIGRLRAAVPETLFDGDARAEVTGRLAGFYGTTPDNVLLAPSGMNAIHGALRATATARRGTGRTKWVQLGWLYLDTIALLEKFTAATPDDYLHHENVFDLNGLRALFERERGRIAGLFAEVPTNPLIQTPDLAAVAALCREHDVLLIVDPTIASPLNIDVLPHADLVVNSLTKYTASEGDVILGATVINPASPHADALRAALPGSLAPVYDRDLARLAAQIGDTPEVVATINRNTAAVVAFLEKHPRVTSLHWALHPESHANYLRLARSPESVGSMVSFTVDGPLAGFYDRLRLPKGPSFGLKSSLICPFIYLAHYDLVTSETGRAVLAANRIDPDLLRLSVGCEPADEIIAALTEALD
ncbi:MAG: PLP-dependent transferase [Verrucomicrobiota bacterium]